MLHNTYAWMQIKYASVMPGTGHATFVWDRFKLKVFHHMHSISTAQDELKLRKHHCWNFRSILFSIPSSKTKIKISILWIHKLYLEITLHFQLMSIPVKKHTFLRMSNRKISTKESDEKMQWGLQKSAKIRVKKSKYKLLHLDFIEWVDEPDRVDLEGGVVLHLLPVVRPLLVIL